MDGYEPITCHKQIQTLNRINLQWCDAWTEPNLFVFKAVLNINIGVVSVGEPDARAWLEQHVVTPYWVAHASRFPHSLHLHSNLLNVW